MKTPQFLLLMLLFLDLGFVISKHGNPRPSYNARIDVVKVLVLILLLWWGGFFG